MVIDLAIAAQSSLMAGRMDIANLNFSYTIVVQYYYNNERHAVIRFQHNFNG